MTEWHSPHGSGPAPIGPRDIVDIADEAEAQLQRADNLLRLIRHEEPERTEE